MNRYISKKWLLAFVFPAILLSFTTKPFKSNYSGNWKLNEQKSELGDFGARIAPSKIKVEQKDDAITISKTGQDFNGGETTAVETYTFDGKPIELDVFGGVGKKKSNLKWSDDGQGFVMAYKLIFNNDGQSTEITGTETWSLSADGKTLTAQTASSGGQGDFAMKAVYDKSE